MRSNHIRVACITAILAVSATGCTTLRPIYPDSWPEQVVVEDGACPVIDGEYQNTGEWFRGEKDGACSLIDGEYQNTGEWFRGDKYVADPARQTISLAYLLNEGPAYILADTYLIVGDDEVSPDYFNRLGTTYRDPARDAYRTIALRLADDRLHVEASLADGGTRKFTLPIRDRCRDSLLVVETGLTPEEAYGSYPFLVGSSTYALGRAEDGSLLLYAYSQELVMFIVMPMILEKRATWALFPAAPAEPVQISVSTP